MSMIYQEIFHLRKIKAYILAVAVHELAPTTAASQKIHARDEERDRSPQAKSRAGFLFPGLIHKTYTSYYDNKEDNYAASQYIEAVSSNSLQELDLSPLS